MTEETKLAEAPAEEPVNLDAPAEVTEVAKETEVKEGEPKEAGEPAGEEQPKKLSGAARSKIRETRLLQELQQREREIEELRRSAPAKASETTEEKAPIEADFNGDFFAFRDATSAFAARQAIRDELRKDRETREQSASKTKQTEIARERSVAHLERVEDAREVIADFDQTMKAMDGVNVRQDVIDEIMSSDKSALLAYHLAKNPSELAAMDRMSARELARAMGRLEATLDLPTVKKQTSAPAPLAPLKGGAAGSFDPEKASMDDYVAKRTAGWKG